MNRNIRKITDAAMMAAIIGVMLILNRQTAGLFEGTLLFLFPLPMVFYSVKYGMKSSWMLFVSIVILGFMFGTIQTMLLVTAESLIGLVYGSGVHNGTATRSLVLRTVFLAVVTDILSMLVFAKFFGYDLTAEAAEYENLLSSVMVQGGQTMPANLNLGSFIRNIMITATIMTGIMEGLITHFLSRILLKRMRFPTPKETPFSEYFPPKWSGYLGILGYAAYFFSTAVPQENEILQGLLQGGGMLAVFYLAFYGAVMLLFVFGRQGMKGIGIAAAVFLLLTGAPILALAGFLYITTDLHQRMLKGGTNASIRK